MTNKKDKKPLDPLDTNADERETQDLLIEPLEEEIDAATPDRYEADLAQEHHYDTQHTDGHTFNPQVAKEQGLTYTPPTDPPIQASEDDPQGAEVAAGFAPAMEETSPDRRKLPPHLNEGDLELRNDIYKLLHYNSETLNITEVNVEVEDGVVRLTGVVPTQNDLTLVHRVVSDMDGIDAVYNELEIANL